MRILLVLFLSFGLYADNEIYIDQTGDNGAIDIEQLGSTNIIGGADAVSGQMTAAILNGGSWVFDINQMEYMGITLLDFSNLMEIVTNLYFPWIRLV